MIDHLRAVRNSPLVYRVATASAMAGLLLLVVNVSGFVVPLRADDIDGYRDFAGVETLNFETSLGQLELLAETSENPVQLVSEATRLFHAGIAHVSPDDVREFGLDHYRMRVPATENWILFALSFLKPDTYRDYEFCSYKRALERGTGRCGQQSMALVSYLDEFGLETGFVALEGHAVATAKVGGSQWYLLDADYGGVIPFDIEEAERNPESVIPYYWSDAARENDIHELYAPENSVKYGGPEARYARACPIEKVAYVLKWAAPLMMLMPMPLLLVVARSRRAGKL